MFTNKAHKSASTKMKSFDKSRNRGSVRKTGMSKKFVDNFLSCRFELKYRISESKAAAVEQFVRSYLHLDRYSQIRTGYAYPIISLYMDSANLNLCRETLTGKKSRFKLRIRSYSDDLDKPRFFEIKRRVNNVIIKSRVRVMDNEVASVIMGHPLPPREYKNDENVLRQFQLYMNTINARPMVLIRYIRKAYESDSDNRVRVTFDRQLCYNVTQEPKVRFNCTGWQKHPLESVILEIKFTSRYPAWLSRMVKCFNLQQQSMSKYASSVKHSCSMGFCAPLVMGAI